MPGSCDERHDRERFGGASDPVEERSPFVPYTQNEPGGDRMTLNIMLACAESFFRPACWSERMKDAAKEKGMEITIDALAGKGKLTS